MTRKLTARQYFTLPLESISPAEEAKFFSSLKMRNGTFKTTQPSRFAEIEALIGPIVSKRAGTLKAVMDVGASSGATTLEFADFLKRCGADVELTATDLYAEAHLMTLGIGLKVMTDSGGYPLQYEIGGKPVRSWIRRLDYLTLAFLPRLALRAVAMKEALGLIKGGGAERVALTSRRLTENPRVRVVQNDIMARTGDFAGRFDFIRAANILNRNYFPAERLNLALANIRYYLTGPGALLLVTRSSEGSEQNAASLFGLEANGRFIEKGQIGGGSEIRDLVLNLEH